jgi:CDGSH-type Zn-finger protein/uncharacterized Fe-S cluster protein YjdI
MTMHIVRGKLVVVEFDGAKCIHSRHCVLDSPDAFVPNAKGEWIHPDAVSPETVMRIAHNCPSGAITARRLDGGAAEVVPVVNVVRVLENGPLAMHAELMFKGQSIGYRATLCRCGQSKNKPFCDGSHASAGFVASGEPAVKESTALDKASGPLVLEPKPNGPLHVAGSAEVVSGTGRTINRATELWLCRCGQSKNKPFCDSSHVAAGFKAD